MNVGEDARFCVLVCTTRNIGFRVVFEVNGWRRKYEWIHRRSIEAVHSCSFDGWLSGDSGTVHTRSK